VNQHSLKSSGVRLKKKGVGQVLLVQFVAIASAAIVALIWSQDGVTQALAVAFGGISTILGTGILAWRVSRSVDAVAEGKSHAVLYLYLGAIERFLYTVLLFGLGVVVLKLAILPMITGLIAGQVGFFLGGLKSQI
jgi:ATP synthase protein I